jgi:hypothetical protein
MVLLAAALACVLPGAAGAQARMVVKVATAGTENIIRTDIGRATFGSGIQFNTSQLRWTMDNLFNPKGTDWQDPLGLKPPVSSNTYDAIKSLKLGTLRFPHGDSSFLYISENPQASYPTLAAVSQWNRYLTPDEIVRYTGHDRLDMERIFEVNTVFSLAYNPWRYEYLNSEVFTKPPVFPVLNRQSMDMAARRAADWVERDTQSGAKTQYWEVGNEDWARWNGNQYADIFFSFQDKMKAKRPEIKLLAQGLLNTYERNTPDEWLHALKTKLETNRAVDSVYAYSIHRYMAGGLYPPEEGAIVRRQKQTQDILAQVADDTQMNHLKSILGTGQEGASTGKWKIWMTEFNVLQPSGRKNSEGRDIFETSQDMGNALVIADWTGKMLEQNVERMVMHSLDHNLESALVQYANGTDIEHPMVTTAGHAYAIYAQAFGKTMVRSKITGNVTLTAPNKKKYPQLAVYSSISADGKSLRVMAINRHMTEHAVVNIDTEHAPGKRWLANGRFEFRELRAGRITDGNQTQKDLVRWSDPRYYLQAVTGIENITLAPASANLFIMPLQ